MASAYNKIDRLPTISASEALQNAAARMKGIPTGVPNLDSALLPEEVDGSSRGLPRGQITEVYGPPGVGKTSLAMQSAVNALQYSEPGSGVVWIDTSVPLPGPRFHEIFSVHKPQNSRHLPSSPPVNLPTKNLIDNMSYFSVPTLAHLLVLFLHPTPKFPPPRTSLIVVDNISAPFATAFPRSAERKAVSSLADAARKTSQQKAANRKWAVAGDLASAMAKMAKLHDIAILVINQAAISIKGVQKATLKPSLSGHGWNVGIHNRILLFRDFVPRDSEADITVEEARNIRFAEVSKVAGNIRTSSAEDLVAFVIEDVSAFGCIDQSADLSY